MSNKTKEELTKQIHEYPIVVTDGEALLSLANQYAEQEAIAFAEWTDGNGWRCFLHDDENVKHWEQWGNENIKDHMTTAELYQLFKLEKSQQ